jgi:1-acyl-sn-glycerol-3-phosphate acyltransferase
MPGMNPSYFISWHLFRLLYATYFRWRVFHSERVPLTGPVIIASNHLSFLDPPLVGTGVNRSINYMARKTLFRYPGIGALLRSWNAVPIDRDGGSASGLKEILDRLKRGGAIILFPEGTRSVDGNAPVVPTRVFGTFEAYGKGVKFPRPHRIAVKYGEPMDFAVLRAEAKICTKERLKQIYQEAADELMAEIGKLQPCWDKAEFP